MRSVNTDVAYDYIRKRILSGEYEPGRPLMTEMLSSEIGVSRTPVRDAFRKLEADGLVTIRAHLGASVKRMDLKEFRELCDLRLALESHAAGLAAKNRTESDLQEIQYALESMRQLTVRISEADQEQPMLNELVREDVRFHIAIMGAAKNDLMKKEILRLHLINRVVAGPSGVEIGVVEKSVSDARRRSVLEVHEKIFDAIARSDSVAAMDCMIFHISEMVDNTLRRMVRREAGLVARDLTPDELAYNS